MKIKNLIMSSAIAVMAVSMAGCGANTDSGDFEKYATDVSRMEIPKEARIIALGEATHGNAEFQELKLDVLKELVEQQKVRSFALEADFGGCERVNEYIHGADITVEEAVEDMGFEIYCTDQMAQLADWMKEYNETAEEPLNFYGFDMQRYEEGAAIITQYCKENGIECDDIASMFGNDGSAGTSDSFEERIQILEELKERVASQGENEQTEIVKQCISCLIQNLELGKIDLSNPGAYSECRDRYMAENISWILEQEKKRGSECIMISGHDGHVAKQGSSYTNTGSLLAEQYGEAYFVIGTDFYDTECNFPTEDGRKNASFCSKDPLAKMAKDARMEKAYLDFDSVTESGQLAGIINQPMKMGSLGEYYAWYMKVLPQSYRIEQTPAVLYDAMIFVPEATPTKIWGY